MAEELFIKLSASSGLPVDQLKFVIGLLLNVLVATQFHRIPTANAKHVVSIVWSLAWFIFSFGPFAVIHSVFTSLVTYFLVSMVNHKKAVGIVLVFNFGYLSLCHIYRQYTDYMGYTMDFSTSQMILCLKLIGFAFSFHDAQQPIDKVLPHHRARSIAKLPSLLEYFGFVYFFCGFSTGPVFDYREYEEFISLQMFQDEVCKGKIPNTTRATFLQLGRALLCIPMVLLAHVFPMSFLASETFAHLPFFEKWWRMIWYMVIMRFKYYFAWHLAEVAYVACGIGYNGFEKNGSTTILKWDRFTNVQILGVELPVNIRSVTLNWNSKVGDWLRVYIYERVHPKWATLATFFASSFWHGFYPGYYLLFLTTALYTDLGRDLRRFFKSFQIVLNFPKTYDVITTVVSLTFMDYATASFPLLGWDNSIAFLRSMYFLGHFLPLALFAGIRVFRKKDSKKQSEKKNYKQEAADGLDHAQSTSRHAIKQD